MFLLPKPTQPNTVLLSPHALPQSDSCPTEGRRTPDTSMPADPAAASCSWLLKRKSCQEVLPQLQQTGQFQMRLTAAPQPPAHSGLGPFNSAGTKPCLHAVLRAATWVMTVKWAKGKELNHNIRHMQPTQAPSLNT